MDINYKRKGNKVILTVSRTELYRQPSKKDHLMQFIAEALKRKPK